ncbi:hypothetical protein B2J93_7150 [Marssonina coronariae]|uniref:Uncharacterized protein n=1 Tax=Diplocarpon coronariae TaxID=2795749 RepID=A0A218Z679_9HELO|nr:hypothetical protein B2J93_7150 [Marssonina coronariae]
MSAHRVSGIDALPCAAWAFTQLHHYRGWPCFTPPEPAPYRAGEHRHDSTSEETRISRPYDVIPAQDLLNPLGRMLASLSTALRTGRREQRRTGKAADRGASHPENHCAFDLLILPQTQAVWEFPPGPRYVCKTIPNSQDPEPRQDAWDKARGIRSLGQRFCRTGSHASKELAGKEAAETRVRGGGGGGAEAAHLRAPTFLTSAPGHVIGRPNWKLADSDVSIRGGWGNTAGMREKLWAESGVVGRRSSLDQTSRSMATPAARGEAGAGIETTRMENGELSRPNPRGSGTGTDVFLLAEEMKDERVGEVVYEFWYGGESFA